MEIMIERVPEAAPEATHAVDGQGREPIIQRNGAEYLVTVNGGVFLALSLAQAHTIANRMGRRQRARE